MHARQLVQLAATVASHSSLLIHHNEPFPEAAIEVYWTASKSRQEGWARALKQFTTEKESLETAEQSAYWIQPVLEEVLTSEPLTRIWAAVSELSDDKRKTAAAGPVAQNILAGHLEARNRVLNLMVYGYGLKVEEAVALNRLRLRNERWTDALLSLIGTAAGKSEWAFQASVVRRLAVSIRQRDFELGNRTASSLLLANLAAAYHCPVSMPTPHAELNRRIASSVMACFAPHTFDSTGQFVTLRQLLLLQATGDSQGKIRLTKLSNQTPADLGESPAPPSLTERPFRRFDSR